MGGGAATVPYEMNILPRVGIVESPISLPVPHQKKASTFLHSSAKIETDLALPSRPIPRKFPNRDLLRCQHNRRKKNKEKQKPKTIRSKWKPCDGHYLNPPSPRERRGETEREREVRRDGGRDGGSWGQFPGCESPGPGTFKKKKKKKGGQINWLANHHKAFSAAPAPSRVVPNLQPFLFLFKKYKKYRQIKGDTCHTEFFPGWFPISVQLFFLSLLYKRSRIPAEDGDTCRIPIRRSFWTAMPSATVRWLQTEWSSSTSGS